ncbi:MAG TPA: hypothetical protein H9774_11710 [Candidatus Desulfovibrio gallistercoris]|nr:hypothetical protein [Candidatus Desulfovibrio gallistercoris]
MGDALRDAMEMPQGTGTEMDVEQELKPLVAALADRLRHARGKHDWPQVQHARYYALTVLGDEVGELRQAITHEEGRDREMDEALDCIAVLARFWLGDHLPEGEK